VSAAVKHLRTPRRAGAAPFLSGASLAGGVAALGELGATPLAVASIVAAIGSLVGVVIAGRRQPAAPSLDLREALAVELERSRRHGRRFTLLRTTPTGSAGGHLPALRTKLRAIDLAWAEDGCLFVLLPEATRTFADGLVQRLQAELPDAVPATGVATAVFPDDGVTSGALLATLDLPREPAVEPLAEEDATTQAPGIMPATAP
jgi:hypothetical protein